MYAAKVAAPSGHNRVPSLIEISSLALTISSSLTVIENPLLSFTALIIKKSFYSTTLGLTLSQQSRRVTSHSYALFHLHSNTQVKSTVGKQYH